MTWKVWSRRAYLGARIRVAYTGFWHDPLGRQISAAEYGALSTAPTRPSTIPTRSDTILVTSTEYDDAGFAYSTLDPAGKEDRVEFDDAGRTVKTIENYHAVNPTRFLERLPSKQKPL